jgi:hypothetical protein
MDQLRARGDILEMQKYQILSLNFAPRTLYQTFTSKTCQLILADAVNATSAKILFWKFIKGGVFETT